MKKIFYLIYSYFLFSNVKLMFLLSMGFVLPLTAQDDSAYAKVVGKMSDVMWKGDLEGKILVDTLLSYDSMYGLGPCENLSGEILVWEGNMFISSVKNDKEVKVEKKNNVKAPFFAYSLCKKWNSIYVSDSIITMEQLELFIDKNTVSFAQPFLFKIFAEVDSASVHVVNLPPNSKVSSPDDAHKGRKSYRVKNEEVLILGFFSKNHKTIFTHHDTFLHLHLMTLSQQIMGHLDECYFKKGSVKLLIPAQE